MALPYVTIAQAEKIAKEIVKESSVQPEPTPVPGGFKLDERFFKTTASIDFDSLDADKLAAILNYFSENEWNYFLTGYGYSSKVSIVDSETGTLTHNNVFYLDLSRQGEIISYNAYQCLGYKLSELISYLNHETDNLTE